MDDQPEKQGQPGQSAHSPIFSKKRKTATRGKKKTAARPGGASLLESFFQRKSTTEGSATADENSKANTSTSSYAISQHDEQTDIKEGLSEAGQSQAVDGKGDESSGARIGSPEEAHRQAAKPRVEHGDAGRSVNTQETPKEYSNEARTYHARYDELSRAHDHGHYTWCREGCLDFLTEPRIPLWTRIQTLQMLSTLLQPAGGELCLRKADEVLDILDQEEYQTKLLREDNRKMKADTYAWRVKMNLVGKSIEGVDGRTGRSTTSVTELGSALAEKLVLEEPSTATGTGEDEGDGGLQATGKDGGGLQAGHEDGSDVEMHQ